MSRPPLVLYRVVELRRTALNRLERFRGGWHPSLERTRAAARGLPRSCAVVRLWVEDLRGQIVDRVEP